MSPPNMNPSPRQRAILSSFRYHKPSEEQIERISFIRRAAVHFAEIAIINTPESDDQTHGLRLLHEAMMTFNKCIACETPESAEPIPGALPPLRTDGEGVKL